MCLLSNLPLFNPTYGANGQGEAHSVEHCGGDCAVVVWVLDAVVTTEKASLVRAHLTQVKGCQGQTSCEWRDQEALPLGAVRGWRTGWTGLQRKSRFFLQSVPFCRIV